MQTLPKSLKVKNFLLTSQSVITSQQWDNISHTLHLYDAFGGTVDMYMLVTAYTKIQIQGWTSSCIPDHTTWSLSKRIYPGVGQLDILAQECKTGRNRNLLELNHPFSWKLKKKCPATSSADTLKHPIYHIGLEIWLKLWFQALPQYSSNKSSLLFLFPFGLP